MLFSEDKHLNRHFLLARFPVHLINHVNTRVLLQSISLVSAKVQFDCSTSVSVVSVNKGCGYNTFPAEWKKMLFSLMGARAGDSRGTGALK